MRNRLANPCQAGLLEMVLNKRIEDQFLFFKTGKIGPDLL
jgi:hypothetical protein